MKDLDESESRAGHPFRYPLERCPECGSERLEAVVELETVEVHFLCGDCGRCWHVEFGRVHRMSPPACHGCPHRAECEPVFEADHAAGVYERVMTTAAVPSETVTETPFLRAILNLSFFHRDHEKFYASAPREQAIALQRHARTLLALADRWSSTGPRVQSSMSPFEGCEDLNDPAALQLDGVLFMEGEGEPAEISRLKRDLRVVADDSLATAEWLDHAMCASWDVAAGLLDVPGLADLLGERHRIIADDWHAAHMSGLAGRLLSRAVEILDRVDFAPAELREELRGGATPSNRCYSAAELIGHAADLLSDSAGLVHGNERRWRMFRARVAELIASDAFRGMIGEGGRIAKG